jgi:hypothetical protein
MFLCWFKHEYGFGPGFVSYICVHLRLLADKN